MGLVKSTMAALLGAALVAGCGGGGGGGGSSGAAGSGNTTPASNSSPSVTPGGNWLTLSPAGVSLNAYEDENVRFQIRARSSRTFDKPFNVAVVDTKGVVASDMALTKITDLEYQVDLRTNTMTAGVHTTNLEVRLCEDDPLTCRSPLQGSPWYLPVTVTVATAGQAQERLKLTPAAFDLITVDNEPVSFKLDVASVRSLPKPASIGVFDSAGVLAENTTRAMSTLVSGSIPLSTSSKLAVGEHVTSLEVRACYDNPIDCRSPVSGSPWRVPLKVTVKSGNNLPTLGAIPALSPWNGENGNAAQNAYAPASFSSAAFTRRWIKPELTDIRRSAPVIENGRVFFIEVSAARWDVVALSEAGGEELWRRQIDQSSNYEAPAVANGKVFARSSGPGGSFLWTYDQASGQQLARTPSGEFSEMLATPIVSGDSVYLGYSRGIDKFNAATGAFDWQNTSVQSQVAGWSPTVVANRAYAVAGDSVFALDTTSGSVVSSFQDPALTSDGPNAKRLVVAGNTGLVGTSSKLFAFNLQTRNRMWMAETWVIGQPVLANDTVYALTYSSVAGLVLEARAAATGVLQWKSAGLAAGDGNVSNARLIVTSNLVFVSANETVALDLATRKVVWTYPAGGALALSDRGILYIKSWAGRLVAVNLR
jgi:hypothetical protein